MKALQCHPADASSDNVQCDGTRYNRHFPELSPRALHEHWNFT